MNPDDFSLSDMHFFQEMSSLYAAVVRSAQEPIKLTSFYNPHYQVHYHPKRHKKKEMKYYELAIMKERIRHSQHDLQKHYQYHQAFSNLVQLMDQALSTGKRDEAVVHAQALCTNVHEYMKEVVVPHLYTSTPSFLHPVSIHREHEFFPSKTISSYVTFNPKRTIIGACDHLKKIQKTTLTDFNNADELIPFLSIRTEDKSHKSLEATLQETYSVLEQIGFHLNGKVNI